MTKQCKQCHKTFSIDSDDLEFYKKISVPEPKLCPTCRHQRRCNFRNEKNFFNRQCDLCKKNIVSIFPKTVKFPVYCHDCFWSDKWDPTKYGVAVDYTRPFFEQYYELTQKVPHLALINSKSENSEYTNYSTQNKNCYMCAGSGRSEECYYCNRIVYCKDCVSCFDIFKCELCYECVQCTNCFSVKNSVQCADSHDLEYCSDCVGCGSCFGCVGLRNKQNNILNQPYSEKDYQEKIKYYQNNLEQFLEKYQELKIKTPKKFARLLHCEKSSGNHLENCHNARHAFMVHNADNIKYMHIATEVKDEMDITVDDASELGYEICGSDSNYYNLFCMICWFCKYTWYNHFCFNSSYLFGCVSMKKNNFCILNKDYHNEDAFNAEKEKLIKHMSAQAGSASGGQKTGEWGEFFPNYLSPFAYNESIASLYFPLSKEEILSRQWLWRDDQNAITGRETIKKENIPEIEKVDDSIVKEIFSCEKCQKNYKVIKAEIRLYKQLHVPIPNTCPHCRDLNHIKQLESFNLWHRQCMKPDCKNTFETTYSPDRKELVYCEDCYNKEIY